MPPEKPSMFYYLVNKYSWYQVAWQVLRFILLEENLSDIAFLDQLVLQGKDFSLQGKRVDFSISQKAVSGKNK